MYKTLLIHVRATPECLAVLAAAVDLAERQELHLIGLGGAAPYFPPNGYVSGEIVQTIAEDQGAAVAAAEEAFRVAAAGLGGRASFKIVGAGAHEALIAEAAAADLIVAPLERRERPGALDIGALVLEAGAPVLAVPPGVDRLTFAAVLLAWRDTLEARRAVTAAIPLLKAADAAAVVEVVETEDQVQPAWEGLNGVLGRLSHHGVLAEGEVRIGQSAARALLEEADGRGSDLLVLGAFGHSRAREWLLGGVTRALLEKTAKPLLLVH
jgi:nucleotide-binding universal stress UspA family protein